MASIRNIHFTISDLPGFAIHSQLINKEAYTRQRWWMDIKLLVFSDEQIL
jgi:hypothetical protein